MEILFSNLLFVIYVKAFYTFMKVYSREFDRKYFLYSSIKIVSQLLFVIWLYGIFLGFPNRTSRKC